MGNEDDSLGLSEEHVMPPKEELKVKLESNDTLSRFALVLASAPFDPQSVEEPITARINTEVESRKGQGLNIDDILGLVGEVHVASVLNNFARRNRGRIKLNPLPSTHSESDNFRFERRKGNIFAVNKPIGDDAAEYDLLFDSENIHVAAEVKLSVKSGTDKGKPLRTLASVQKPDYINKKFGPLMEIFPGGNFGFLIIGIKKTPKPVSITEKPVKTNPSGALVVYLPMAKSVLLDYARELHKRFFPVKPTQA